MSDKKLRTLLENLRSTLQEDETEQPEPDLRARFLALKDALTEGGLPPGTVHKWSDGNKYIKMRNGDWVPLTGPGAGGGGAPAGDTKTSTQGGTTGDTKTSTQGDGATGAGAKKSPEREPEKEPAKADDAKASDPYADEDTLEPGKYLLNEVKPQPGEWKDALPFLPKDTSDVYFDKSDGEAWKVKDPERKKLHERILKGYSDHVPPARALGQDAPTAIMMLGGPASGKSSAVRGMADSTEFVVVDPDGVKGQLPEYRAGVRGRAKNAAALVHEESSFVSKQIREQAIADQKNVLIDGTGKNLRGYMDLLKKLKSKGYHVKIVMAHADEQTARKRGRDRAEKTGRYVPDGTVQGEPDFYADAYKIIPGNFEPLAKEADEFAIFDTREYPAKKVWSKEINHETGRAEETAHDPKFVETFKATHRWKNEGLDNPYDTYYSTNGGRGSMEEGKGGSRKNRETKKAKKVAKMADFEKAFHKGQKIEKEEAEKGEAKFKFGQGVRMVPNDD